ncbi:MAG: hypothetical protein ACI4A5_11720, partial [Hominilimicola sp.]
MSKTKRIVSLLISLSMILALITVPEVSYAGTPVGEFSKDEGYSTIRGDLYYEYLGTTPASQDTSSASVDDISGLDASKLEWEEGGLVWIAVKVANMTRLKEMFRSTDADSSAAGLETATLSLAYDDDYFELPINSYNGADEATSYFLEDSYPKGGRTGATVLYTFATENAVYDTLLSHDSGTIKTPKLTQSETEKIKISTIKIRRTAGATSDKLLFMDGAKIGGVETNVTDDPYTLALFAVKMKGST